MEACTELGLRQIVRQPTRGKYLLDLVLTDLGDLVKASVLDSVADHRSVLCELRLQTPKSQAISRKVWLYQKADWEGLKETLKETDWSFLNHSTIDEATVALTQKILAEARRFIPQKDIREEKGSHRWIDDKCREAAKEKSRKEELLCASPSIESEASFADACNVSSALLGEAYSTFVSKTRGEIDELLPNSKKWWTLNRELMQRATKASAIPPLKDEDGLWVLDPRDKANVIAKTFSAKCSLPPSTLSPIVHRGHETQSEFIMIRRCWAKHILKALDEAKTTGPDALPSRILKYCALVLDLPVTILTRRIVNEGVWPDSWKDHWIHPLFKKGQSFSPLQYRGLHLTSILSKSVEKIIACNLTS